MSAAHKNRTPALKQKTLLAICVATAVACSAPIANAQNTYPTNQTPPAMTLTDSAPQVHAAQPYTQGTVVPSTSISNHNYYPQEAAAQNDAVQNDAEAAKKKQAELNKKAASSHKPLFFDNDFSYLCDDAYSGCLLGDGLKKLCLPRGGWYDIGGQYRARFHSERNMRGLGLTGVDDDFLLHRTRLYGDFHFSRDIRVYAEMLDAESNYENFGPRPIEVNRFDMQNLFVDAVLIDNCQRSISARIGRQELLFGAQRFVSPLDWANTRRTFEGARFTVKSDSGAIDAFWTNPMRIDDHSFDSPDRDQEFMGIYASNTQVKDQTLDVYYLRYLNGRGANDFQFDTIGSRWQGSCCNFLWEVEGAFQFGDNTDGSNHEAAMFTLGVGRKFGGCWQPTLWAYYDWASGDDATGAGNGFHHNFPLAHKYNGFMDLFGRRNLEDVNLLYTVQPSKKLKLLAWYHYFFLENKNDTPYSVVMTPFNGGNAPGAASLGHELDFLAAYKITPRQDLVLGYSHFFAGDYYSTTAGVPFNGDADFFYSQWHVNF